MTITNLTDKELSQAQRIAELEAEIERLTPLQFRRAPCHKFCEATAFNIQIRQLRAQIETLQRDAKRYRWFSDIAVSGDFEKAEEAFACFADAESCTEQELDAAIDAAIAAMGGAND